METIKEQVRISVSATIGEVSGVYTIPDNLKAMVTLAHGAGTDYNHRFLVTLSEELALGGIGTLRFNFPYTEKGKRMPDRFPVASATVLGVIAHVKTRYHHLPIFCSGKSFGGRMSSQTLANSPLTMQSISGLVFFGFPLHPANTPSVDRAEHLQAITIPMLFLQGTKDTLAYLELIRRVNGNLKTSTLVEIDKADHSFQVGKQVVTSLLVSHTKQWIDKVLKV